VRYLLDTNVCIAYLNGRSPSVRDRLLATPSHEIAVCSVVKSELFYGALRSKRAKQTLREQQALLSQFTSLPFDDRAARLASQIRSQLASSGTPIGPYDLQIAAIALAHDLIIVTHNVREFSRVRDLKIEDWEND